MSFYLWRFVITWLVWLLLADKKRWRELLLVGIFAGFLGLTTDVVMDTYHLWEYPSNSPMIPRLTDDFSLYMVAPYLFLQYLSQIHGFAKQFLFWLFWIGLCIGIEYFHHVTHHMIYHKWWNIKCSFVADWVLYAVFYYYHRIFRLCKLN